MTTVAPNLTLTVVWSDPPDLQAIRLSATSEFFSGAVGFYAGYRELEEFAVAIQGFPNHRHDVREYSFGQANLSGYGRAAVRFSCEDSSGHLFAEITMRSNPDHPGEPAEAATVRLRIVPSDLDRFVEELRGIDNQEGQRAVLANAA